MSDTVKSQPIPIPFPRKSKLEIADATETPHRSLERNPRSRSTSVVDIEPSEIQRLQLHRKQSLFVQPTLEHGSSPRQAFEW